MYGKNKRGWEQKYFPFTIESKDFNEQTGDFKGYLSTFSNQDKAREVVEPGAFKKTLMDAYASKTSRGGAVLLPILWQHKPLEPIGGFIDMQEDEKGLFVNGNLDIDTELGRRAHSGLKKGYLGGLSIGYRVIRDAKNVKTGARHLQELALIEGSVVTFPANTLATVSADDIKSMQEEMDELETKAGRAISGQNATAISKAIADAIEALTRLQNIVTSASSGPSKSDDQDSEDTHEEKHTPGPSDNDDTQEDEDDEEAEAKAFLEKIRFKRLLADMNRQLTLSTK